MFYFWVSDIIVVGDDEVVGLWDVLEIFIGILGVEIVGEVLVILDVLCLVIII